jgi:hypothetical protein
LVACSQFCQRLVATGVWWVSEGRLHPLIGGGSTAVTRKLAWRLSAHQTDLARDQRRSVGVPRVLIPEGALNVPAVHG